MKRSSIYFHEIDSDLVKVDHHTNEFDFDESLHSQTVEI